MSKHVKVRMYNVGFGDCFLLEFPREPEQAPFRILVDCGAHRAGYPRRGWMVDETVDAIIKHLSIDGTPRLDVVVATHRHQDHVSGFGVPAWSRVQVGEVWLPWTEHPTNETASEIRTRQSSLAMGLAGAARSIGERHGADAEAADAINYLALNASDQRAGNEHAAPWVRGPTEAPVPLFRRWADSLPEDVLRSRRACPGTV